MSSSSRVSEGDKYHPLPGNRMDFSGSVAEEVTPDGHVAMATIEVGCRRIIMPRRGMSNESLQAFASFAATIDQANRASGLTGDFVLVDSELGEVARYSDGQTMFFCCDDPALKEKLILGYQAIDRRRIAKGLPSSLAADLAALEEGFKAT